MSKPSSQNRTKSSKYANGATKKPSKKKGRRNSPVSLLFTFIAIIAYLGVQWYHSHGAASSTAATQTATTQDDTATTGATTNKKRQTQQAQNQNKKSKSSSLANSATESNTQKSANTTSTTKAMTSREATTLDEIDYESGCLPILEHEAPSQVLYRRGYTLSYNKEFCQPNWVIYELLHSELEGNIPRQPFQEDPDLGNDSPKLTDYYNSGYDRGHIAPAADFSWDSIAKIETFYLSNMSPQLHEFNAGIWLNLENRVRDWARKDSAICIVAGPVLTDAGFPAQRTKLNRRVVVPQYFYKVILAPFGSKPKAIGFIIPYKAEGSSKKKDKNAKKTLAAYAVSVDSVEAFTGIDFFPTLPDNIERSVESSFSLSDWGL